jgi:hypothetical protein
MTGRARLALGRLAPPAVVSARVRCGSGGSEKFRASSGLRWLSLGCPSSAGSSGVPAVPIGSEKFRAPAGRPRFRSSPPTGGRELRNRRAGARHFASRPLPTERAAERAVRRADSPSPLSPVVDPPNGRRNRRRTDRNRQREAPPWVGSGGPPPGRKHGSPPFERVRAAVPSELVIRGPFHKRAPIRRLRGAPAPAAVSLARPSSWSGPSTVRRSPTASSRRQGAGRG